MTIGNTIERATQAQLEKNWAESLKLWKEVDESAPSLKATFGIAFASENLQDFARAYDLYLALIEKKPNSVRFRHGLARVCMALENYELAKEQWESLAILKPEVPKWTIRLVRCLLNLRLYDLALSTLDQAVERWPTNELIQQLHKKNKYLYSDEDPEIEGSDIDLNSPETSYDDGFRWINSQRHNLDGEEYSVLLARFADRWKDKIPPKLWLAQDHFRKRRFSEALAVYCGIEKIQPDQQQYRYGILECLIALDEMEQSQGRLRDYIHGKTIDLELDTKLTWLLSLAGSRISAETLLAQMNTILTSHADYSDGDHAPMTLGDLYTGMEPKRPIIARWNFDSEINISSPGSGDAVFILFTGYGKKMGTAPVESIDSLLAGYGASLILLKDHSGRLYQRGISEVAPDFESTIDSLKEIISGIGAKRVFTIGSSGGCFGALRYGLELKAHNILLFSGPTNLSMEFMNEHGDYRGRAAIRKLNREFSAQELDMGTVLEKTAYTSNIDAYYAANNQYDASQALYIEKFPNVRLHPIEFSATHDAIGTAFSQGILGSHLEKLLGTLPDHKTAVGTL